VRLFDWPARIEGIERTLEFIGLTIRGLRDITYRAVERAIAADTGAAFVRVQFDWTRDDCRLRSNYVVIYRYRDGLIGQQELYTIPVAGWRLIGAPSAPTRGGGAETSRCAVRVTGRPRAPTATTGDGRVRRGARAAVRRAGGWGATDAWPHGTSARR
jgi:hypothetical protein